MISDIKVTQDSEHCFRVFLGDSEIQQLRLLLELAEPDEETETIEEVFRAFLLVQFCMFGNPLRAWAWQSRPNIFKRFFVRCKCWIHNGLGWTFLRKKMSG